MPKKTKKKFEIDNSLAVHSFILDAVQERATSAILTEYDKQGWELMTDPVLVRVKDERYNDRLGSAKFLFILRKKQV